MATITDVQNAVASQNTVVGSAVTLLNQLTQMLQQAIAADDPAQVQQLVDQISSNTQNLANAVAANTPAQPTPAPASGRGPAQEGRPQQQTRPEQGKPQQPTDKQRR